jgi:hypothetical protein
MPRPRSIDYRSARSIVLLAGMVVIALVAATMLVRGVDPIEVTATLSFAPIFVAMLFFGWRAGAAAGLVAAGLYFALRFPAIELVGIRPLLGLIISRCVGFVAFGAIGGWAAAELGAAIGKLERYDMVDDATGLGNARSVIEAVDREMARADRHQTVFSVAVATFQLDEGGRRQSRRFRDVGRTFIDSMRASDHTAHIRHNGDSILVAVLPETGPEGASTVAASMMEKLAGVGIDASTQSWTMPGDDDQMTRLLTVVGEADAASRPRAARQS